MPYSEPEKKVIRRSKKKQADLAQMAPCRFCKEVWVHHPPGSFARPCDPCYAHSLFDTCCSTVACTWCERPATEFWVETMTFLRLPYCGTCKHVSMREHPEHWALWPWQAQREALWAPGGPRERLAAGPYAFVLLPPFRLLHDGWRARVIRRGQSDKVLEQIDIAEDNHFLLWYEVLGWVSEQPKTT